MSPRFIRASLLFDQRRFLEAEAELRAALKEGDASADVHALLGLCLLHAGLVDEAKREVEQALSMEPNDPYGHYALSFVFERKLRSGARGRRLALLNDAEVNACLASARRALELAPEQSRYVVRMAEIQYRLGLWREAARLAEQALQLEPESVPAMIVLSRALVHLRKHSQARALLTRALELNPEESVSHADMGWALLRARDFRRAKTFFEESLRLNSNSGWAQEGVLECAKHEYRLYRWASYFREWLESLHPLLAIPVGLLILAVAVAMLFGFCVLVVPFVHSRFGANVVAILCVLVFGSALVFLIFRNPILLFLIRRHSAAQTTAGERHRDAALGRILKIALGITGVVLFGVLGDSRRITVAMLCGAVPGFISLWIAWKNFTLRAHRKFWLGYGAVAVAAGIVAGIFFQTRVVDWEPGMTFVLLLVVLIPPGIAAKIEKKRSVKRDHTRALEALNRKQKN
jgi:tetratricopeptide (TPR) repeat protein